MTTNKKFYMDCTKNILRPIKFQMAPSAILKFVKSSYLNEKIIRFWRNSVHNGIFAMEFDDSHVTKIMIF